jgi:hypothetical protein
MRYQYWDRDAGRDRYVREYVPRRELPRVRRWIRRARAETAFGWGQAGFLRRLMTSVSRAPGERLAKASISPDHHLPTIASLKAAVPQPRRGELATGSTPFIGWPPCSSD